MACSAALARTSARVQDLVSWDSDWAGLRVVVTGIGVSGFAAQSGRCAARARCGSIQARGLIGCGAA